MLRWFLADLRTGRQILDLQPLSGNWERFVNAPERVSCTLDMRDPDTIALRPRVAAAVGRAVLAVAADDVVLAAGPIWAHRYDRDQKKLELNARGLWSYYDHRFVLPVLAASVGVPEFTVPDLSAAGKTKPNPDLGTYLNGFELGTIAKKLVQQAHTWTGGAVPVVFEADRAGTHERVIEGAEFKNLGAALKQLTEVEGGPDIRFRPRLTADRLGIEWVLETGTQTAPLLSSNSVHQWDMSVPDSAVSDFEVTVDGSNLAGVAWATGGRSGDEVIVARAQDSWLTDHGWPLFEDLDSSHSSVSQRSTLDAYAAENSAAGRGALEEWAFTVEAGVTPRLGEFLEGDWCDITFARYGRTTDLGAVATDGEGGAYGASLDGEDGLVVDVESIDSEGGWGPVIRGDQLGDPYLFEGGTYRRRITGISGDEKGLQVKVTTAPEVV